MREPAIIGFIGENANGVLRNSTMAMGYHFAKKKISSPIIDLCHPECFDYLRIAASKYDILFCFGYAGIGAHLKSGEENLWDKFKMPFLSLMYDHPFYYPTHHNVSAKYVCNCYASEDFLEVQHEYIKSTQPAVLLAISSNGYDKVHDLPWAMRDIGILFCKTGQNLAIYEDSFKVMPAFYRSVTMEAISAVKKKSDRKITDLVRDQYLAAGIDCREDDKTWDDFVYIVRIIDQYIRDYRSNQLIEKTKHLPVIVVGNGWDHIDKEKCKAVFKPSVSAVEFDQLVRRSKIILNSHPYGRNAWHERVFQGLESGAAVISDRTDFTDRHFSDLANFVGFDWSDPEWPQKVEFCAQNLIETPFDILPARHRLMERFPPDATANQMIELGKKLRG
ncbi:MAG: hypothetical protein AB7H77_10620 [Bdellovibrionales bacterium]